MSSTVEPTNQQLADNDRSQAETRRTLTSGRLPNFIAIAVLVVAIVVVAAVLALLGAFSIASTLILGTVVFLVGMLVLSTVVEGGRRARDRFARYLVTIAFVIALLRRAAPCPAPRLRSRLLHRRNRADIRRMIGLTAPGQERSCPRAAYRSLSRSDPILAQRELFSTSGAPAPCPHL